MTENRTFVRKVIYLCAIAVLLIPLYQLGHPATAKKPGGLLARQRAQYRIAQTSLGEIDPASETAKLAALGMRGVAGNMLWMKAIEYTKKKNWEAVSATLNTIVKVQPNFSSVWEFQSHNLSYNMSVQFDDYRHRYMWVKRGLEFSLKGTKLNRNEPRLIRWNGWVTGQKFGRADERVQFRKLYSDDVDFHDFVDQQQIIFIDNARRSYDQKPDNWLVARLWYLLAEEVVASGEPVRGKRRTPVLFYSDAPMSLINFASTIQKEGYFEAGHHAWIEADGEWAEFSQREIPTSYGISIQLGEGERIAEETAALVKQLEDEIAPGVRDKIFDERIEALTDNERRVLEMAASERTDADYALYSQAKNKTEVTHADIASRVTAKNRAKAQRISKRIDENLLLARRIKSQRGIVNFDYWRARCETEKTEQALIARKTLYEADEMYRRVELEQARKAYERSWKLFAELFKDRETLVLDPTASGVVDPMKRYIKLLGNLGVEPIPPADFPLMSVIQTHREDFPNLEEHQATPELAPEPASQPGA